MLRPFKPLVGRFAALPDRTETLESQLESVQARLVELAHAQQQVSSRQQPLFDAAELLDVLERRVHDLEEELAEARRTLDDLLDAVSHQNALAREARRLNVEEDRSQAVTDVVAGRRAES